MAEKVVRKRVAKTATRKTATRKAPSRASSSYSSEEKDVVPFIVLGVFVLVIGISIGVGYLDRGQINVQGTIEYTKEHGTEEEKQKIENLPVQKTNKVRNNGLVPSTGADREKALQALDKQTNTGKATTSASSTDETASSTEASAESEQTQEETTEEEA